MGMLLYNEIIYTHLFFFLQKVILLSALRYAKSVPGTEKNSVIGGNCKTHMKSGVELIVMY